MNDIPDYKWKYYVLVSLAQSVWTLITTKKNENILILFYTQTNKSF